MKKFYSISLAALLLITLLLMAPACALYRDADIRPDGADKKDAVWPHETSDLDPSPDIVFGRLENGIRYVILENEHPENRVSMHLNVQVGSFHEEDSERGIAHYLEHMLFLGTEHFEPGELVKYFQRIGMRFGPDVNARTGFFHTIYDIDLPEGEPDKISEGLLVLRDYAAGGLIPEEQVDRERSVILAEKRTRDSPSYRTFKETLAFEVPGTRITRRLPIGDRQVIKDADRALIRNFYDTWYRPENMVVVMVGDLDAETAGKKIENRFSDIEARAPEKPDPDFGDFSHHGVKPFYHYEPESGDTRVSISVAARKDQPEDTAAFRKNKLLERMANRIVQQRLDRILNTADAPFTDAGISSRYYFMHVRAAEISARSAPDRWEESLGLLENTIRKALKHGFTQSEAERVRREFIAEMERSARAASTRRSSSMARQFLNDINRNRVPLLAPCRLELFRDTVESATAEDLHNQLRDAWSFDHRLLMVTGNADLTSRETTPEEAVASVYGESREKAVQKPVETDLISFPYLDAPDTRGEIQTKESIEDLGITRVRFENGHTLFVRQTDYQADEVKAYVRFGEGRREEPPERPGLSEIAQAVVNLGGTGTLDREQLRSALAGTSTAVSFQVEADAFTFSGTSVPDETRLLFELLYTRIQDPAYREGAYDRALRRMERRYESLAHSIEGALQLEGRNFLAGGDSRFGLPEFEQLAANTIKDVEKWIEGAKAASPLEIAVVGDVDPDEVIELAAAFLGSLPGGKDARIPDTDRHPVFPAGERLEQGVPTRIERALVMVVYPTTDTYDIDTTRRLSILSDIFSDRMRLQIREDMGATYSQSAYNSPSRAYEDWGLFGTYTILDPADAEAVEARIRKIAEDIRESGVTEDELERAVRPVLANITSQVKTNEYWLNTVLKGASRHPEQLDWSRTIFVDYAAITVDEINRAAQAYLEDHKAATLFFYPGSVKDGSVKDDETGPSAEEAKGEHP